MTDRPTHDPHDELEALLKRWHEQSVSDSSQARDRILSQTKHEASDRPVIATLRRIVMNRYSPMAASLLIIATVIAMLVPAPGTQARADEYMLVPEGGRLEAVDADGNVLGPCELTHTDVDVFVSGRTTRVDVRQKFHNPHDDKIEAVYTFPLSHNAAVDQMTMTIGDRVVVGEVKERSEARQIYEAARAQGRVASLLEQERPNIFTQSVANIEPGSTIIIQISYVETLEHSAGTFSFSFPTVVGPRYIPGYPSGTEPLPVPEDATPIRGVVLLAPATITITESGPEISHALSSDRLLAMLRRATPVAPPANAVEAQALWHAFSAEYIDGSAESGTIRPDGYGRLGARWFYIDPDYNPDPSGGGFAPDTNQVPDASRITPQPVRPERRAGHDISIDVVIDSGGPAVLDVASELHRVVREGEEETSRVRYTLANERDIPNRDFVLSWRLEADAIEDSVLVHRTDDGRGGFFAITLEPPAAIEDAQAMPRELVFVLDTSGSMGGFPIEKAKASMARMIDQMRDGDTFNLITFAGDTHVLWPNPRPATEDNINEAQSFLADRSGGGGTEMMKAIKAALERRDPAGDRRLSIEELADLPADGREVALQIRERDLEVLSQDGAAPGLGEIQVPNGDPFRVSIRRWTITSEFDADGERVVVMKGRWSTKDRRRVLEVGHATLAEMIAPKVEPIRIVCFMTDGYVGNDQAIIAEIRANRDTSRVFAFGIGNSVNRYLLDNMAAAGGGEVEYVLIESDGDAAADRFSQRTRTPVLANIKVDFDGVDVSDVLPNPEAGLPDLWDQRPVTIFGRYDEPGRGTVTISGMTATGPFSRTLDLELDERAPEHSVVPTLWARTKVDEVMLPHLAAVQQGSPPAEMRSQVVALGESFNIMTQYTSFVAVDKLSITVGGEPRLVRIPIEMPDKVSWEGIFGGSPDQGGAEQRVDLFGATLDGESNIDARMFGKSMSARGATFYNRGSTLDYFENTPTRGRSRDLVASYRYESPGGPAQSPAMDAVQLGRKAGLPALMLHRESKLGQLADGPVRESARERVPLRLIAGLELREEESDVAGYQVRNDMFYFGDSLSTQTALGLAPARPSTQTATRGFYRLGADHDRNALYSLSAGAVMTINPEPAPLADKLQILATNANVPIVVDWESLSGIGVTPEQPVEVEIAEATVPLVLDELLAEVATDAGTPAWDVTAGTVTIASEEAIAELVELRVFDVRALLSEERTIQSVIDHVRDAVPAAWGEDETSGSQITSIGQALAILTTPKQHALISTSLNELNDKGDDDMAGAIPLPAATVLWIDQLVRDGRLNEARFLAIAQHRATPDLESITRLREAFAPDADTQAVTHEVAEELRTEIAAYDRSIRIINRVDERFIPFVDREDLPTTFMDDYKGDRPIDTEWVDGGILISVLLDDPASRADDLAEAGMVILSESQRFNLAIGRIPIGRIADIATLDGVILVEPTE